MLPIVRKTTFGAHGAAAAAAAAGAAASAFATGARRAGFHLDDGGAAAASSVFAAAAASSSYATAAHSGGGGGGVPLASYATAHIPDRNEHKASSIYARYHAAGASSATGSSGGPAHHAARHRAPVGNFPLPTFAGSMEVKSRSAIPQSFDVPINCEMGEEQRSYTQQDYNDNFLSRHVRTHVQPRILRQSNPGLQLHTEPIRVADHTLTSDFSDDPDAEQRQAIVNRYGTINAYKSDMLAFSEEYPPDLRRLLQEGRNRDAGRAAVPSPEKHKQNVLSRLRTISDQARAQRLHDQAQEAAAAQSTDVRDADEEMPEEKVTHIDTSTAVAVKKYRNILQQDMDEIRTWYKDVANRKKQEQRLLSKTREWFEDARNLNISRGEQLFELCYVLFDEFGSDWERTPEQCRFHDHVLELCAPLIYKDDFQKHRSRLLKRFKKRTFGVAVFFAGPRRWGKSVGLGQDGAVTLYIGRGIKTVAFAQTLGIACELVNKVKMFFMRLPDAETRILRTTSIEFLVSHYGVVVKAASVAKKLILNRMFNKMMARSCIVNSQATHETFV